MDFLNNYDHELHDSRLCGYGNFSDEWVSVVNSMYNNETLPAIHSEMFDDITADSRFRIGKKRLSESEHWLSNKIEINIVTPNLSVPVELSFEASVIQIAKESGIEVLFPVFEASINSSTQVVADMDDMCLYINSTFSKDDLWQLLKEIYRLEKKENSQIWKDYVKLLNK